MSPSILQVRGRSAPLLTRFTVVVRTPYDAEDQDGKAGRHGAVRMSIVPAVVRVGRPSEAHQERSNAAEKQNVADPVERLHLLKQGAFRARTRRRL